MQKPVAEWPDIVAAIRALYPRDDHRGCGEIAMAAAAEIEKLRAAQPPLPEWQPIETAPPDEPVLVWWSYWSLRPFIAEKYLGRWTSNWVLSEDGGVEPLAWMPLPAPPASGSTKVDSHD
jgi:hypothetical protein